MRLRKGIPVATLREVSAGEFESAILEGMRPEQRFTHDLPSSLPSGIVVVVDQG